MQVRAQLLHQPGGHFRHIHTEENSDLLPQSKKCLSVHTAQEVSGYMPKSFGNHQRLEPKRCDIYQKVCNDEYHFTNDKRFTANYTFTFHREW